MTLHSRLLKIALLGATLSIAAPSMMPAFSSPADVELLKSYVGAWKGRGTTTSSGDTETVVCKLDITDGSAAKINYNGRCTLAGANLSIAGTMAYSDENNRFEAVMSSNTAFSGVAVGRRRGKNIDFQLKDKNKDSGADYTIDAGLALKSGDIEVSLKVVESETGRRIDVTVPFKK